MCYLQENSAIITTQELSNPILVRAGLFTSYMVPVANKICGIAFRALLHVYLAPSRSDTPENFSDLLHFARKSHLTTHETMS